MVNGFDAWVQTRNGNFALSSQMYAPRVVHPTGARQIESFELDPWPRWRFQLEDGTRIEQEVFLVAGASRTVIQWRVIDGATDASLSLRPFFSGRDAHALHYENPQFRFDPESQGPRLIWRPYEGVPAVSVLCNGDYVHHPDWYRNFLYSDERARGLDCTEDLASPGIFRWNLSQGEAVWIVSAEASPSDPAPADETAVASAKRWRTAEQRRRKFPSRLHRAADAYLSRGGKGPTIVAGYPWLCEWSRDTFVALRGLCLAAGRLDEAREILLAWAGAGADGLLPDRLSDCRAAAGVRAIDASLWYVIAVHDYLQTAHARQQAPSSADREALQRAVEAVVAAYAAGVHGARVDDDGLLAVGVPGRPATWMDAQAGDWIVTPRIGKPVEVQALWLNALRIAAAITDRWEAIRRRGMAAFESRFWNDASGALFDVVDGDHEPGRTDPAFRPNQIFAVGGLPYPVLNGDRARRVVDAVEHRLVTPVGLRTLAPDEADYAPRYEGGVRERDGALHQGSAWPWLLGAFVEAWVRVRGETADAKRTARQRFLAPLLERLDEYGLGHLGEVADGDPPHAQRGCPFRAWSVAEALRLDQVVLADTGSPPQRSRSSKAKASPSRPPRKKPRPT